MMRGRGWSRWLVAALLLLAIGADTDRAEAHEFRPIVLDVAQTEPDVWMLRWMLPVEAAQGSVAAWLPILPEQCTPLGEHALDTATVHARVWTIDCAAAEAPLLRLPAGARLGNVILTYDDGDTSLVSAVLPPGQLDIALGVGAAPELKSFPTYLVIGAEHILLGPDHLLFVLCLLLLIQRFGPLAGAITGFTIGHSVTLIAAAQGWLTLPSAPVEACIALSILWLADEAIRDPESGASWTRRAPWATSAAFGTLHGLGFAGALAALGLPEQGRTLALAGFNLGVELGQIAFVAVAWPLLMAAQRRYGRKRVVLPLAGFAGVAAAFWAWERVLATFGVTV
jgi:hypothetical protein